ncbi:MAG: twin-arginine translocation signal domain-containing protein, partial [Sphingobacteriales bacterium]
MTNTSDRRQFLRDAALATAGFAFLPSALKAYSATKIDKVRVGMI